VSFNVRQTRESTLMTSVLTLVDPPKHITNYIESFRNCPYRC